MILEFSFQNFEEVKRAFDPKIVQKAINSTIPRTARKARTEVSKQIRSVYAIKAATVKETVTLRTERKTDEVFSILSYRGASLPIDRFSTSVRSKATPKGRRTAVSARVKKSGGRKLVKGGFPLQGRTGPTMKRTGDSRLPIERVFSLSVPQMLNDDIHRRVQAKIEADANIELNRNLQFFQDRAAR